MTGVIVSGGNLVNKEILYKYSKNNYVICADSGIRNFLGTDIIPDMVVGDFDSSDKECKEYIIKNNILTQAFSPIKDYTDSELAVNIMLEKKIDEIIFLSALGTRFDHSIANIFMLRKLYGIIPARIIDKNNEIMYFEKCEIKIEKQDYKYISIVPISEAVIASSNGLFYEMNNTKIDMNSTTGVSNEILNESAELLIHSGDCLLIKSKD